jgi:hypothetical protein
MCVDTRKGGTHTSGVSCHVCLLVTVSKIPDEFCSKPWYDQLSSCDFGLSSVHFKAHFICGHTYIYVLFSAISQILKKLKMLHMLYACYYM